MFLVMRLDKNIDEQKTQIFFSKNVDQQLRNDMLQHITYTMVTNVDRYLGANIDPGMTTRGKFNHIIGKIQSKWSG